MKYTIIPEQDVPELSFKTIALSLKTNRFASYPVGVCLFDDVRKIKYSPFGVRILDEHAAKIAAAEVHLVQFFNEYFHANQPLNVSQNVFAIRQIKPIHNCFVSDFRNFQGNVTSFNKPLLLLHRYKTLPPVPHRGKSRTTH